MKSKTAAPDRNTVDYSLIRSARKTIAICVSPDGTVTVRAPRRCSKAAIEAFVKEKQAWIRRKQEELAARARERKEERSGRPSLGEEDYRRYRETARRVLTQKAEYYARLMQVSYGRIAIRDQKTRWGSCSAKGNLNFSWRLILMPEPVLDYVVVHELAHRREMNHSPRFWALVEEVLPDYRQQKLWLKKNGAALMEF